MLSSLLIFFITSVLIITALYNDFKEERKQELEIECNYIATALTDMDINYLLNIGRDTPDRITLISSDGTVLYDSAADIKKLENHLNRPEIAAAIKNGSGEATRLSDTLGESTYYYAKLLENGNILRLSTTIKNIFGVIDRAAFLITLIILLAIITAIVSARILTKTIIAPINKLNLDAPLTNSTYDELSPLLLRMDKQNKKISEQFGELEAKQAEFNTITENMNEAIVIFGENKHILFANKSAKKLFGYSKAVNYLELCRDAGYIQTVEAAFVGKSSSDKINKNGRIYQLSVNPVKGNMNYAAVLFAVDITEKEQSEKMRREFSANVSHELKTPLTSIIGYAEIIQNGIAKKEDYPRFAEQIFSESKRLLYLIEDIIKLSRLDEEGLKKEFVPVDLYLLSENVITELNDKAKSRNVSVSLEGKSNIVNGIERTLHEIIFNLCDNALIYNKDGGSVIIRIEKIEGRVILSVIDTGIGISLEHQNRIFERFYRVDKSRSKETGGTGLGLSIVKHGAMLHNADIKLESALGKGTTIKIKFKEVI